MALGWFVTVIGAVTVGVLQTSDGRSCEDVPSWCFTPIEMLGLALMVGSPVLLAAMGGAALFALPLSRRVPSAPLAGTLAAAAGILVVALVGGLILANR